MKPNFFKTTPVKPKEATPEPIDLGPGFTQYGPDLFALEFPVDHKFIFDEVVEDLGFAAMKSWNPYTKIKRPSGVSPDGKFWWANKATALEFHKRVNAYLDGLATYPAVNKKPTEGLRDEKAALQHDLEKTLERLVDLVGREQDRVKSGDFIEMDVPKKKVLIDLSVQKTSYRSLLQSAADTASITKHHI